MENRKEGLKINVVVHFPETEEKRRELAKRVAVVHAQTVIEKISTLSCPVEQKAQLIDVLKRNYIQKERMG